MPFSIVLTPWWILQNATIVISTWDNSKISWGHCFADWTASNYFNLSSVILTGLWYIQMVHAIVCKLVAGALRIRLELVLRSHIMKNQIMTYMDNSLAINKPHHSWSWMSCDAATESSAFAFLNGLRLRFADKDWCTFWFCILIRLFRWSEEKRMILVKIFDWNCQTNPSANPAMLLT